MKSSRPSDTICLRADTVEVRVVRGSRLPVSCGHDVLAVSDGGID